MSRYLSPEWLAEATAAVADAPGAGALRVEVTVAGAPAGKLTYHLLAEPGGPLELAPGPDAGAPAHLDLTWADAVAEARGELDPAVAYMQGRTKTKGATAPVVELLRRLADPAVAARLRAAAADAELE
ncbi:MAG: hypothetical protein ACKVWR_22270 [Acidimicrobiales bacterium]